MSIFNYREGMRAGDRIVLNVDGVEYAFRWCPAGSFTMGIATDRGWLASLFATSHQANVTLTRGFWMLETQVTQKMWKSVMGTDPSHFKGAQNPVEGVSWDDCQNFCKRLSDKLGVTATLPTEAQWEYACRAGTTTAYAGSSLDEMGWYRGNTCSLLNRISRAIETSIPEEMRHFNGSTHPVGQKKPNAWGLYDMHGNVCELCLDLYSNEGLSTNTDPCRMEQKGADSWLAKLFEERRVVRGGCWWFEAGTCCSDARIAEPPRSGTTGFRFLLMK